MRADEPDKNSNEQSQQRTHEHVTVAAGSFKFRTPCNLAAIDSSASKLPRLVDAAGICFLAAVISIFYKLLVAAGELLVVCSEFCGSCNTGLTD
jgi:hypothetical protein